jgi:enoyl-CoA hydratase/carnithine racemase
MYECNFVNSVVSRDQLEAETRKYAEACARTRPTDAVFLQKTFFEVMKQHQGEYMGSILSGLLESFSRYVKPDADDLMLSRDVVEGGINKAVKNNDSNYPPDFRLSKTARDAEGE